MGAAICGQRGLRQSAGAHLQPSPPQPDTNVVYSKEAVVVEGSGELVEKDTEDAEDTPSLNELLLPPMEGKQIPFLPRKVGKFSVCYSMESLQGWVKQPSPCCAAASVAGAWNSVFGLNRSHPQALSHVDVLDVYVKNIAKMVAMKIAAFERRLGACITPLLEALEEGLQARGTPLGGKDAQAPKREAQLQLLHSLVTEAIHEARSRPQSLNATLPGEPIEEGPIVPSIADGTEERVLEEQRALPVYERFWELYQAGAAQVHVEKIENEQHHTKILEEDKELQLNPSGHENPEGFDAFLPSADAECEEVDEERVPACSREHANASAEDEDEEYGFRASDGEAADLNDAVERAETVQGQKGMLLEFDFPTKKKKRKPPPKALARRLQVGKEVRKRSAAAGASNCVQHTGSTDRDDDEIEDGKALADAEENIQSERVPAKTWWECSWQWESDMLEILRLKGGIAKLTHSAKPNTSIIGNWAVMAAIKSLEARATIPLGHVSMTARVIVGRGKPRWPGTKDAKERGEYAGFREGDSSSVREDAWCLLRNAFMAPGSSLIYHLKNHYALIFALREWEDEAPTSSEDTGCEKAVSPHVNGEEAEKPSCEAAECSTLQPPLATSSCREDEPAVCTNCEAPSQAVQPKRRRRLVRQMLTARRGQRPSVWLDFEEAVRTMLSWEGYKIIQVQLTDPFRE